MSRQVNEAMTPERQPSSWPKQVAQWVISTHVCSWSFTCFCGPALCLKHQSCSALIPLLAVSTDVGPCPGRKPSPISLESSEFRAVCRLFPLPDRMGQGPFWDRPLFPTGSPLLGLWGFPVLGLWLACGFPLLSRRC